MDFESLYYEFIQGELFNPEDRPKTLRALRTLCERVPDEVLRDMPPGCNILAPSPWMRGLACVMTGGLIYLAPRLEDESQEQVDFTVAHEFAHLYLRHHEQPTNANMEDEANALVKQWGYNAI
jgi:hypothetical protein